MIALLFPLLAIAGIAYIASRRHVDQPAPSSALAIATTSGARDSEGNAPSPLVVLDGFLRMGQQPTPFVISCAIAEAELLGRPDVVSAIVQSFILPVVAADDRRRGGARGVEGARGMHDPHGPRGYGFGADRVPMPASAHRQPTRAPFGGPPLDRNGDGQGAQRGSGGHHYHPHYHPHGPHGAPRDPAYASPGYPPNDSTPSHPWAYPPSPGSPPAGPPYVDPAYAAYPAPAGQPGTSIQQPPPAAPPTGQATQYQPQQHPQHAVHPMHQMYPMGHPSIGDPAYTRVEIFPRPDQRPAQASPNAGTITVSGRSSPIEGIGTNEWAAFVGRVSRELPTFMTDRHVGRFRQRRDRLAELGIDPASIVGSPEAQRAAFDQDMMDAYRHANDAGLVAEYRGVAVEIPAPQSGEAVPIEVTLSGVMGVIQAAGLEGAAGWLERPEDRRRFPGTTAAFLRTNGVF